MDSRSAVAPMLSEDHVCAGCGMCYAEVSPADAMDMIRSTPAAVRAAVRDVPDELVRRRPEPAVWSMVEYVCHVRDVYVVYTIRLHRARTEDEPVLEPMLNDLRVRRFRYNERELPAVLDELDAAVVGCGEEFGRMAPTDWDRQVTRLPGEWRTARWLVRQAAHEGTHHCADIEQVRESVLGSR
jgi:hypothetical protein